MKNKGQGIIWGAGSILLSVGLVLFIVALKEQQTGLPELAFLEYFIAVVLLLFAMISFYIAHK